MGPRLVSRLQAVAVGEIDGIHRLAVDVELQLIGRAVADPYRAGPAVALEVVENLFFEVRRAVDPVHDLQRAGALTRSLSNPVPEPAAEGGGLFGVAEPEQRVHGEGGVADPGVSVVPVALAAHLFGEAGRGGGDQCAGRGVGHQLERHRRAGYLLLPTAVVRRAPEPTAPEAHRVI